jgi:hypothetical protein
MHHPSEVHGRTSPIRVIRERVMRGSCGPASVTETNVAVAEERAMIELVILFTFFGVLIIGATVANARSDLPTAAALEAEDHARDARILRSLDSTD